jgi:hypothetical protein
MTNAGKSTSLVGVYFVAEIITLAITSVHFFVKEENEPIATIFYHFLAA